jgi:ubiquinone/menaquinone biosynthesis C-methylase UbiE
MQRVPEPELMLDADQAAAYASADFEVAHSDIVNHFTRLYRAEELCGPLIDLGCGPADITVRFARLCPNCRIDALDGSKAMLEHARVRLIKEGLKHRVRLVHAILPHQRLDALSYATIISNSLLHHLHDPDALWQVIKCIARPDALIYIADLMRPETKQRAAALLEAHMQGEPSVLRRDFYNSLLAAFSLEEVEAQLRKADLNRLVVAPISDRHLIVHGRLG